MSRAPAPASSVLLGALAQAWLAQGTDATLRRLATAAGTTTGVLRARFGDRDGVLDAIAAHLGAAASPFMAIAATPQSDAVGPAVRAHLEVVLLAWRQHGVDRVILTGLAEGLRSPRRGRAFVNHTLEPTLQTTERLLQALVDAGALRPIDTRAAALSLASPLILALIHQEGLDGANCRPLDVHTMLHEHTNRWLAAWAPELDPL